MEFLGFILNIIITIYLIVDAPKHFKSSILWGIFGFLFGLIALAIYFIKTGKKVLGWVILIPALIVNGLLFIVILLGIFMMGMY